MLPKCTNIIFVQLAGAICGAVVPGTTAGHRRWTGTTPSSSAHSIFRNALGLEQATLTAPSPSPYWLSHCRTKCSLFPLSITNTNLNSALTVCFSKTVINSTFLIIIFCPFYWQVSTVCILAATRLILEELKKKVFSCENQSQMKNVLIFCDTLHVMLTSFLIIMDSRIMESTQSCKLIE